MKIKLKLTYKLAKHQNLSQLLRLQNIEFLKDENHQNIVEYQILGG